MHTLLVAKHSVEPECFIQSNRPDGNRTGWKGLLIWFGFVAVLVIIIRTFVFGVYSIPSGSMLDTIKIGNHVIGSIIKPKINGVKRGDIIVFHDPAHWLSQEASSLNSDYLIKRLIALPGDTVACQGRGKPVTINGVAINESSYIRPGVQPSQTDFKVTVTPGHVFVMGDNRADSADSRFHQDDGEDGLVPIKNIVSVGVLTIWPLNNIGPLKSHHEVFKDVHGVESAK